MIQNLKSILILEKKEIFFEKTHDSLIYGFLHPRIKEKTNAIKWECKEKDLVVNNVINSFPNKGFTKIAVIKKDSNYLNQSIDVYNCDGSFLIKALVPSLKINFKSSNTFKPSFTIGWFKEEELREIDTKIGVKLNLETTIKLEIEFPDYSEYAWIDTNNGTISPIFCTKDFGSWLDSSKNTPVWYNPS